jgi:hypothetical protein
LPLRVRSVARTSRPITTRPPRSSSASAPVTSTSTDQPPRFATGCSRCASAQGATAVATALPSADSRSPYTISDPRTGSGSATAVLRLATSRGVALASAGVTGAPATRSSGTMRGVPPHPARTTPIAATAACMEGTVSKRRATAT